MENAGQKFRFLKMAGIIQFRLKYPPKLGVVIWEIIDQGREPEITNLDIAIIFIIIKKNGQIK